jgi:hypothetical protein
MYVSLETIENKQEKRDTKIMPMRFMVVMVRHSSS